MDKFKPKIDKRIIYPHNHPWAIYQRKRSMWEAMLANKTTEELGPYSQVGKLFKKKPKPMPRATLIDLCMAVFDKEYKKAYQLKHDHALEDTAMFTRWNNKTKEQNGTTK